ncbi:MAG: tetratricopeptide repeat protein, partial [Chloroflexi bacterium]|nr:tetratricopeptide repeat protein [Chloroflexota bacterium]
MADNDLPFARPVKFSVPSRAPDVLRRHSLVDYLHENIHHKLVLVAAAAGYGKTSLLADFAREAEYKVAWLTLDEFDRDLVTVASNLVTALRWAFPTFTSTLSGLAAEAGAKPGALALALAHEIESTIEDYFVLALDDFHLVEEASLVLQFFDVLLANLPEQAHLLIAGRTIPPLQIASLAARRQIAGLSEEQLRFTPAEAQELVELRNQVVLPEAEAEKLVANTEGWITGILLTTHLMWQGLMASLIQARQSEKPVYEYLVAEVLNHQPETLRQFLLESSILPEMEPAVCNAVLGRTDSGELLQQAESRRLFISAVGDEFPAYQYHPLFREFLLARLRAQNPERLKALQVKAAEWFAANGMVEAAVTFYVTAGQLNRAADLADAKAESMFTSGRHVTLRRWAEQLAAEAQSAPELHLLLSISDGDAGQLSSADRALAIAEAGFADRGDAFGRVRTQTQRSLLLYRRGEFEQSLALAQASVLQAREMGRVSSEALALRYVGLCQFALSRLAAAEESLQQVVRMLQAQKSRYDLATALNDLSLVLRAQGETARAARAQQQSLAIWRELAVPGQLGLALNNVGWDLHMLGQYESALATYREALNWTRKAGSIRFEAIILAGQGDVHADLSNYEIAKDFYHQAMPKAEQAEDWDLMAYVCRCLARLDRFAGNYLSALEWLRRASLVSGQGKAKSALANVESLHGIVFVEMGHLQEGKKLLEQVSLELEQSGSPVDLAQTLLFRACAEFRAGDLEASANFTAQALKMAEQVGYDQMLVSEALAAQDLLEALSSRPDVGPRASGLLARARAIKSFSLQRPSSDESSSALPQPAILQIRSLGQSRVLKEGEEISKTAWGSQKVREVLFFLVDQAPVARDRVLETFWPEKPATR